MKATIMCLLLFAASSLFAQDSTLVEVNTVKPLAKDRMIFERNVKMHVAKFHPKKYPFYTYEIISGPRMGTYYFVNPMGSWADLDKQRPDHIAHEQDIQNNIVPYSSQDVSRDYYRYVDSLSHRVGERPTSLLFRYYYVKPGKGDDFISEVRRSVMVSNKFNSISNYSTYVKQLSGINPEFVIIHGLKNGFSQLEPDYMSANDKQFKDTYIEMYGQDQWDKRMHLLPELCHKVDVELAKFRPDLSTK